ncbi:ParB/RepB/Spo0J family partition protein [Sessilibacter corallicola]|uniref:Probable chromosome-partitioning protein ParB n=1 Tax=Sessilibacter corallicola TaxID=2904075 RepID=A0ABQ0ABG3_9GAMM|nr:ParB/RepB/Spo0J family partition protein [Sessilibacter corallicola]MCE2028029.1 ParB/RepB/Spo0J family partition protein [Sessilibacter corallicola]
MAAKRKGLGRGLDALLGGASANQKPSSTVSEAIEAVTSSDPGPEGTFVELPVEFIQRGKYQPRRDMNQEALQELADSIKVQGVMQPIVVRTVAKDRYEIIAGERRWRATQLAQLDKIPAIIRDVSDDAAIAMALIENIQREDLNPMEEAFALKRLQDEFELTHQEVAEAVGKSRTTVTNLLRLLSLCDEVKRLLENGDIEMGHARALLTLEASSQRDIAEQVVGRGLSVRQTEALVRKTQAQSQESLPLERQSPDLKNLEQGLSEKVGVPVTIQHSAKGAGKLVLKYTNLDELDGILAHLQYSTNDD